jgi:hypothetical protein
MQRLRRFFSRRPAKAHRKASNFDPQTIRIPAEVHAVEPAACRDRLTIATIVRNEARYMREWAAFHLAVGADRLVVYDNMSDDDLQGALADFMTTGRVEIVPWPHFIDRADFLKTGFAHAIVYTRGKTRWLACIDADEFLFSPTGRPLPEILDRYDDLAAVIAYWVNFGTSDHGEAPPGLVTENYVMRAATPFRGNLLYKSIFKPDAARSVWSSHRFGFDTYPVIGYDEIRTPIVDQNKPLIHRSEILRINHYYSRSRTEFEVKLAHGRSRHKPYLIEEKQRFLAEIEGHQIEDRSIQQFLPLVRRYLDDPSLARRPRSI